MNLVMSNKINSVIIFLFGALAAYSIISQIAFKENEQQSA